MENKKKIAEQNMNDFLIKVMKDKEIYNKVMKEIYEYLRGL